MVGQGAGTVEDAVRRGRGGGLTASVGAVLAELLPHPLAVFRITDRVTSAGGVVRAVTAAVEITAAGFVLLRDWELVVRLNAIITDRDPRRFRLRATIAPTETAARAEESRVWLNARLADLDPPFQVPEVTLACLLLPGVRTAPDASPTDE